MTDLQDAAPPGLTLEGAVATIEFRRPRQANRVEPEDLDALHRHLEAVERDAALRVLVFRGRGRHFSAGYTIQKLPAGEGRSDGGGAFERLVNRVEDLAVVTIAAVNGGVYGGSTDLALACDFRVGIGASEMLMPAARLGLHYYERGLYRYVSRLGLNHAKELFLTARKIDARRMLEMGYLTELVAADQLDARVRELADTVAGLAPLAVAGMKRALNEIARGALERDALRERVAQCGASQDLREGVQAWQEKRAPRFSGR
ncbi:MAG: enoyl-CoA hydratase/isomerase family protein [Betaproteobacteria bacterium]|nr:MAG: enoyl-CoA hydratase/isomerase family protein [Betaproteobacteria bacterium]